jgi:hypothetical protein
LHQQEKKEEKLGKRSSTASVTKGAKENSIYITGLSSRIGWNNNNNSNNNATKRGSA